MPVYQELKGMPLFIWTSLAAWSAMLVTRPCELHLRFACVAGWDGLHGSATPSNLMSGKSKRQQES